LGHTSPWHIELADKPLVPRKGQTHYLIDQIMREIERNRDVLAAEALEKFHEALLVYEALGKSARSS